MNEQLIEDFKKFSTQIGIKFENIDLLVNAFVHRSYLNENRGFPLPSNERLEFLGDACLELVVSDHLFRNYPNEPEGTLTSYRSTLVNTISLSKSASLLNLGEHLLLSRGEEDGGGRTSEYLLANTFEALLGAIYLDQGYLKVEEFINQHILVKLEEIIETEAHIDPKSQLQELIQAQNGPTPTYTVLEEWGPDHNKTFRVAVKVNNKQIGVGEGSSKQRAEREAAQNALLDMDK